MTLIDTPQIAGLLRRSLNRGQQPFVTIVSNSMAPLLRRGDQVQVETADWQALQPGDVVLVQAAVDLLTHRYWGSVEDEQAVWLLLRGDRPLGFDALLPASSLIGRIKLRRRQRRLLDLQHGAGRWLNTHLTRLSRCEIRLFGAALTTPAAADSRLAPAPGAAWLRRRRLTGRAIRRIVYTWAKILTEIVALAASSTGSPDATT